MPPKKDAPKAKKKSSVKADVRKAAKKASTEKSAKNVAHSDGRAALLEASIDAMRKAGPAKVHPNDICRELGLSKSLVNFHFGGRDGLIAEAIATAYERYVAHLMGAADAAGASDVDRLFAWIDRQVDWTSENPGIACALNFIDQGSSLQGPMDPAIRERITIAGSTNFRNLRDLVTAARVEKHAGDSEYRPDENVDALTSAMFGWLTLGLSVWTAGNHLPTSEAVDRGEAYTISRRYVRRLMRGILEQ